MSTVKRLVCISFALVFMSGYEMGGAREYKVEIVRRNERGILV
jgi:hypothetical protein